MTLLLGPGQEGEKLEQKAQDLSWPFITQAEQPNTFPSQESDSDISSRMTQVQLETYELLLLVSLTEWDGQGRPQVISLVGRDGAFSS